MKQLPFNSPYLDVVAAFIDFESTGLRPGIDMACQVGIAIFENGKCVTSIGSLLNPQRPIPEEATQIHGIDDAMVKDAPTIHDFFGRPDIARLLEGCQPGAYSGYDRAICPAYVFDLSWPWLDALVTVRVVDRFAKGKGRHKLTAVCERHGITLTSAHNAESDARAAGEVFYRLMPDAWKQNGLGGLATLGNVLQWTRREEANAWFNFHSWLSRQPPLPESL